jgi:hypothetical protein
LATEFQARHNMLAPGRPTPLSSSRSARNPHAGAAEPHVAFRSTRSVNDLPKVAPKKYSPALEAAIRAGRMIDEDEFGLRKTGTHENPSQALELTQSMRVRPSGS